MLRPWFENRLRLFSREKLGSHFFFKIQSDIRAQFSRQWLNRPAQTNSIQVDVPFGHNKNSILFFIPPCLLSHWFYKKLPPIVGQLLLLWLDTFRFRTEGLVLTPMILARIKLNNATCTLHSCLTADYILLLLGWGTSWDLKGEP